MGLETRNRQPGRVHYFQSPEDGEDGYDSSFLRFRDKLLSGYRSPHAAMDILRQDGIEALDRGSTDSFELDPPPLSDPRYIWEE